MQIPFRFLAIAVLFIAGGAELFRAVTLYRDTSRSRDTLLQLRGQLQLDTLSRSANDAATTRAALANARGRLDNADRIARHDPFLRAARLVPGAGKNATAVRQLIAAGRASVDAGLLALDVLDAYHATDTSTGTSLQDGIRFLKSQEEPMTRVEAAVAKVSEARAPIRPGLTGPLERARLQLDDSLARLDALVAGYRQADTLLPALLGYDGPKKYLVLPQNDAELFPSGGLISNYGIATFDGGKLTSISFEYFTNLFDRWQSTTGHEYVAPPEPLKDHLLGNVSWGLGEAGWYPDFPATAGYAAMFVQKGGGPQTDGTIAIDTQFVAALLDFLGPVTLPEYGVTVDASNLAEVTLEKTRNESATPGSVGKAFLSPLARELLNEIFKAPRDRWPGLLELLDRMARERHLQLQFADPKLQSLGRDYGIDGGVAGSAGDYLLVADSSVQSTKLNLILQPAIDAQIILGADGRATSHVTYSVTNPFPAWRQGRDAAMVRELMNDGVYGSYLRLFATPSASLSDLKIDGTSVGPEAIDVESGRRAFGRYFPVGPGQQKKVEFFYATPRVVTTGSGGKSVYSLYVQKQAGTRAIPFDLQLSLPAGAKNVRVTLDGDAVAGTRIKTNLRTDHLVVVEFSR